MYKKILIPLDSSPVDETILNHIQPLAKLTGAEIVLVHVADGFAARLQQQLNLEDSEEIKIDQAYIEKTKNNLNQSGVKTKSFLIRGEPSDEILKVADKENCDLIAMSTHGHGFFKDLFLGSVADNIRHRTNIPILMIRTNKHKNRSRD